MAGNNPSYVAGGNIPPSRFVMLSADDTVVVANATPGGKLAGVSFEGPVLPPGYINALSGAAETPYAGIAGRHMPRVYGQGEMCALEAGDATGCAAGDWLKPDANGRGIKAAQTGAADQNFGALVLEGCSASGQLARVLVSILPQVSN